MLGNCAHCHNPRGLPSVTKPELATALNFLPDGKDGGVFEFPFERMSPVRQRGASGDIPIPYITPSLRDYPVANDREHPRRQRVADRPRRNGRGDHLDAEVSRRIPTTAIASLPHPTRSRIPR